MRSIRAVLALCAVLALSGCYVTTGHPVGTTAGIRSDPALSGDWKGVDSEGKPVSARFVPRKDGAIVVALALGAKTGKPEKMNAIITTAALGAVRFMNVRLLSPEGKPDPAAPAGTIPLLYGIDARGTLTVAMPNEARVKAAVRAGRISGVTGKAAYADVILTANAKALDAFLTSPAGLALFDKPFLTLHRVPQ